MAHPRGDLDGEAMETMASVKQGRPRNCGHPEIDVSISGHAVGGGGTYVTLQVATILNIIVERNSERQDEYYMLLIYRCSSCAPSPKIILKAFFNIRHPTAINPI